MMSSIIESIRSTGRARLAWRAWVLARRWAPWLLVLWPVWTLHGLIRENQVNAPFLDDFMSMPLFAKAAQGKLTLHDFFAPQMEHRIAWTRVVLLCFHKMWPHDLTRQVWFSHALLCLTLVNVAVLLRQTASRSLRAVWPLLALAGLSLFSPVQFQVFLWPLMHQVVGLAFFLTGALVVWQTHWPVGLRFVLGLVCALCATLSFGSGILVWLVLVPVIWWCAPLLEGRRRVVVLALWLAAFTLTMALYFHGLKNEVDPEFSLGQGGDATVGRDFHAFAGDPEKSLGVPLRVLGGPLARGTTQDVFEVSLNFGMVLTGLYMAGACYWLWRFRDEELRRRLLPWLALGAYSIGTALTISMGRVWLTRSGINALSGRYLIHAAPLLVALPVMVWIICRDLVERFPRWHSGVRSALLIAGTAMVFNQLTAWSYGERMMEMWSSSRLRSAVNMRFYKTGCPLEYDYMGMPGLARLADDLGVLNPPMLKNTRLDNFKMMPKPLNTVVSEWKSLWVEKAPDGLYLQCSGHARFKHQQRVADGVFLTFQAPEDGHWEIFRVAQVTALPLYQGGAYRKDLEYTFASSKGVAESLAAFEARFKLDDLPKGVLKMAAWACDHRTQSVHLIPGFYEVDSINGTVKDLGTKPSSIGFDAHAKGGQKPQR